MSRVASLHAKVEIAVALSTALLRNGASLYLTLLHSITEERVQQQALQLGVPVERLLDFAEEHAEGKETHNFF